MRKEKKDRKWERKSEASREKWKKIENGVEKRRQNE